MSSKYLRTNLSYLIVGILLWILYSNIDFLTDSSNEKAVDVVKRERHSNEFQSKSPGLQQDIKDNKVNQIHLKLTPTWPQPDKEKPQIKSNATSPPQASTRKASSKAVAGEFKLVRDNSTIYKGKSVQYASTQLHNHLRNFTGKCTNTKRFGREGDGGYKVCMDAPYAPVKNNCLIYSFGIRNEWSFDDDIANSLNCEVHSFDPSMNASDHMHSARVRFHNLGIWGSDVINDEGWNLMSFGTLIKFLGHEQRVIDYLKIDVEGAEWPALVEMLASHSTKNVKQMIFEIHTPNFKDNPMNIQEHAQVYLDLNRLQSELGFRLYSEKHTNGCCGRFATLAKVKEGKRTRDLCCYELFYINSNFKK